jgi:tetratricopeptide (TPR) repeat protein
MERTMKLRGALLFLLIFPFVARPIELQSDLDMGRRCYTAGDFKKAISHFKKAVTAEPNDADSHFWLGKSYEMLADIGGPLLGGRASSKARFYLAKAVQLAPANQQYRREFFDFLVVADHSPGALREAERIIQMTPRSEPDYPFMSLRLEQERNARSSTEGRIQAAFVLLQKELVRSTLPDAPTSQSEGSVTLVAESGR